MKKLVSWLSFMTVFCFMLHSCVQDEIYSSTDPTSKEYHSKSFWKEDEKYIKNVMKIYFEHESEIKKIGGTPVWDYAMSMGKYDETFMAVPIVENDRVVNTLVCARFDKKVYFRYENSERNNEFFNNIIFGKYTRYKTEPQSNKEKSNTNKGVMCGTRSVSMWYPDNESNPNGSGHWETNYYTNCYSYQDYYDPSWEQGGGGFDYNGGGGSGADPNNPDTNQNPCEKTKDIVNNPKMQAGLQELKTQSTQGGEKGIKFKADGTPSATIIGGKHSVNLGDKTGYTGGYHNHTPTGIPMLSPPDIDQLLGFARAQPTSNPSNVNDAYLGMIAPNGMHYVIWFNGTYQDAITTFSQAELDNYVITYQSISDVMLLDSQYSADHLNLNTKGVETLFFDILKKMGLDGKVNLQRIESGGIIKNINLDSNNQPVPTACP